MTLYKKLQYMASLGKDSMIKDTDGLYKIVSHFRDSNGCLRESLSGCSIEEVKLSYGIYSGENQLYWNELEKEGAEFVGEFIHPKFGRFEINDKVRKLNLATMSFEGEYQITSVLKYNNYRLVDIQNSDNRWEVHHDYLTPIFADEGGSKNKEKTIVLDGVEYLLTPKK